MEDGVWRTIRGRRIFIKDGQSLTEAMRDSGKFPSFKNKSVSREDEIREKLKELEKIYSQTKGKEILKLGKEIRELKEELDKLTGDDERKRLERLKNHSVTLSQERILKQMGVNKATPDELEKAIELSYAIDEYTGSSGYKRVRDLSDISEDTVMLRERIETVINIGDKYRGETYRGISFEDKKSFDSFIANIEIGSTIDMKGISSWTYDKKIATDFANQREYKVMLHNKDNKKGANISTMSKWKGEAEILYSSKENFIINNVKNIDGIIYVEVKEGAYETKR